MADVQVFEMRTGGLLSLQTQAAPWLERLAPGLPQLAPCRQLRHGPALWLRLGPHEWWCWQAEATEPPWQAVGDAAGDAPHACVDLSDAHTACVLGPDAQALLSCGCDLDLEQLPADFAARTRLASFTVVLARRPDGAWWLWTEASLAQSLQRWLARTQALLSDQ